MSFHLVEPATARLNRSELAVPGSQTKLFEKAAASDADIIFLDLEDAVAPDMKGEARKNVVEGLNDIDWSGHTITVRINGLDTHYMYRDVVDVIEQAGQHLDMIMIPKVGTAADVYALDMLVTQVEDAMGLTKRIGFSLIIETALGMANVHEIAAASPRNEALHFGVADYAASTKARTTNIGGVNQNYAVLTDPIGGANGVEGGKRLTHWGDMWHYAIAVPLTARSAISRMPTAIAPPPIAPRLSAAKANGRSIRHRLPSATRSLARPMRRSPRPNASSKPWPKPPRRAKERSLSTAGSSISPRSNRPRSWSTRPNRSRRAVSRQAGGVGVTIGVI